MKQTTNNNKQLFVEPEGLWPDGAINVSCHLADTRTTGKTLVKKSYETVFDSAYCHGNGENVG